MPEHPDAGSRFPFINLDKALTRASQFYQAAGDHDTLISDAFAVWSYSQKSSGGFQTISALKMYGLLRDSGTGDSRRVALTQDALRYFRDERPEERNRLVQKFGLSPKLLTALWNAWRDTPPADSIARSHLKVDRGLSEQAARSLLGVYKDNLDFAGLKGSDKLEDIDSDPDEGMFQPPSPPASRQERLKPTECERILSDGLLSKTATYRIIVSGNVGSKEIDRLIEKLKIDKEILSDDGEAKTDKPSKEETPDERLPSGG